MCFGKGLNQNKSEHCKYPSPNNCCGGFALNAVLAELITGFNNPNEVYDTIQTYQTTTILPCSRAYTFLHNPGNIANGTLMSLPSGICAAFKHYVTNRIITVCYNSHFKEFFGDDIIAEESDRIIGEKLGMRIQENETPSPENWSYILVLVQERHWIAVKRIKEEKNFICYDPATGKAETGNSMITAMQELKYEPDSINGLYICIL